MSSSTILAGTPAGLVANTLATSLITCTGPSGSLTIQTNPPLAPAAGNLAGVVIAGKDVDDHSAFSQSANDGANTAQWSHFVAGQTNGGLVQGHYQLFTYNNAPLAAVAQVWDIDNATQAMRANVRPLDATRVGQITATGLAQAVAVPSINASSQVLVSVVGCTGAFPNPSAAPVIAVNPGVGFTITGTNTVIYSYYVLG